MKKLSLALERPTQAKSRLEWGTPISKGADTELRALCPFLECPIQARFWLEWGELGGWTESAGGAFPGSGGPLAFDLYAALTSGGVLAEAAPLPVVGTGAQATLHGIALEVTKLLDELAVIGDIEGNRGDDATHPQTYLGS
jgi:hypothetical protein